MQTHTLFAGAYLYKFECQNSTLEWGQEEGKRERTTVLSALLLQSMQPDPGESLEGMSMYSLSTSYRQEKSLKRGQENATDERSECFLGWGYSFLSDT